MYVYVTTFAYLPTNHSHQPVLPISTMATGTRSPLQTNIYHYSRIKLDSSDIQLKFQHFPSLILSVQEYPFRSLATPHSEDHLRSLGELIHSALEPFLKYVPDQRNLNEIAAAFLSAGTPDPWALALVYPKYIFPALLTEAKREKSQQPKELVGDVLKSIQRFWIVRGHLKEWRERRPGDERIAALDYIVYCVVEGHKDGCLRTIREMVTGKEWMWWRSFEEWQVLPSHGVRMDYTIA
jgi:hypothetical protein